MYLLLFLFTEEASNPADQFHWLPKEHMCVLVYLVRSEKKNTHM